MNLFGSCIRCTALLSAFSLPAAVLAQTATPSATPAPSTSTPATTPAADQFPDSPGAAVQAKPQFTPTGPTVVIDTTMGRLTCKLFSKEAPITTANFIGLAEGTKDFTDPITLKTVHGQRFYDGTTFHRVIPGFMIQGGDRKGDGTGDGS
jgi:peptidyl-prolyl cis-trans isomerase A (cyclophilin A)